MAFKLGPTSHANRELHRRLSETMGAIPAPCLCDGLSFQDVVHQLQSCLVLFSASVDDLLVLKTCDDRHDFHRVFIIRLVGGIDALLRNSNHWFFGRNSLGSQWSGSDHLLFSRRNDQSLPSAFGVLNPPSTELGKRDDLIRDDLAWVGQTTAMVLHEGLSRDVEAHVVPQAGIHTLRDVPGPLVPRNVGVEECEDPSLSLQN